MSIDKNEILLVFRIAGIPFGIPATSVGSILMPPSHITHSPGSSHSTPGIFHHADYTYAVIDLHTRFGIDTPRKGRGRLLLQEEGIRHYAFLVDEVVGLIRSEQGKWADLPNYLPHDLFSIGFFYQDEIVLCTELQLLRNMHDVEPLKQHLVHLQQKREKTAPVKVESKPSATEQNKKTIEPTSPAATKNEKKIETQVMQPTPAKTEGKEVTQPSPVKTEEQEVTQPSPAKAEGKEVTQPPPAKTEGKEITQPSSANIEKREAKSTEPPAAVTRHEETKKVTASQTAPSYEPAKPKVPEQHTAPYKTKPETTRSASREPLKPAAQNYATHADRDSSESVSHTSAHQPTATATGRTTEPIETKSDNTLLWLALFLLLLLAIPITYWFWPQPSSGRRAPSVTIAEPPPVVIDKASAPRATEIPAPAGVAEESPPIAHEEESRPPAAEAPLREEESARPAAEVPIRIEQDGDGTINLIIDRKAASVEQTEQPVPVTKAEPAAEQPAVEQPTIETTEQSTEADTLEEENLPEPCDCTHTVVKGDTLWDIAERYTGNAFNYPELAKRSGIKNPHRIYPGDRVRIIIR